MEDVEKQNFSFNASVNSSNAQREFVNFALPGAGHLPTRGHSRAFDTHAVSYQNITIHMVLLEKKQIGISVNDRNKLKRVIKACSPFYACISSLLIKPELHSENRSYRCESTFFGY